MRTPVIVGLAAAGCLAIGIANAVLHGGWDAQGVGAGTRITSRWAFVFFIAAFSASSLVNLWPGGWRTALLRRRRAVGLSFAASHFVHAGFFLTVIFVFGAERSLITFIGGGLAYGFIAAMAATSNDASVKALGRRNWKLLHQVGGWYVMLIFFSSYLGRLIGDKPVVGAFGVGLIALAVGLRVAAALKGRAWLQAA